MDGMLKKTKDAASELADVIREALEYNANLSEGENPIRLTQVEISRGLMNFINRKDSLKNDVSKLLNGHGDAFEWKTQDNEDMGCFLFINYPLD